MKLCNALSFFLFLVHFQASHDNELKVKQKINLARNHTPGLVKQTRRPIIRKPRTINQVAVFPLPTKHNELFNMLLMCRWREGERKEEASGAE